MYVCLYEAPVGSRIFPKLRFFADFLNTSFISPKGNFIESETVTWDEERSNKVAMGGGARSARARGAVYN
jgi:hypothetical protein